MWSTSNPLSASLSATAATTVTSTLSCSHSEFLRRHARRLLRDGRALPPSKSLPVLRRVLDAGLMPELNLMDLYGVRASLQLKHVLHLLARELGYADWSLCKRQIDGCDPALLDRYRFEQGQFADFRQNWFADLPTARQWQQVHGGYLITYGKQAVAILSD